MTRSPTKPASLPLSREMQLALVLLLLLALGGGSYLWISSRGAQTADQPPATPPGTNSPGGESGGEPGKGRVAAPGTTTGGVVMQPGSPVDVPTLPAYGAAETGAPAAAAAEAPPIPGGINPDTPLAALPGVNPFRPLTLAGTASAAAPAPVTSPALPVPVPSAPVVTLPSVTRSRVPAPTPISSNGERVTVGTPAVRGVTFPTALPSAGSRGPVPGIVTLTPPARTLPTPPRVTVPGGNGAAPAGRPATPAPVRPPLVGMSVPQGGINLNSLLGSGPGAKGETAERPDGTTSPATASPTPPPVTALPTPGIPQPITRLGTDGTEAATGPENALDRLIESRALTLNAAVLGPVNTAVLHAQQGGFLVVSVGQTLPDSDVVVRDVTAKSVTLALGNDTRTLELDKR